MYGQFKTLEWVIHVLQYYQNSAGTPDELAIEGSSDQVESEDEFSGDDESEGES